MSRANRPFLWIALLCALPATLGTSSAADDAINGIVAELKQRTKLDVPTLAEYDILCTYRKEVWTIHSVSVMARQAGAPSYAMKAEAPNQLSVLFPTNTFMAIGSRLDPLSLGIALAHSTPRLLPSE